MTIGIGVLATETGSKPEARPDTLILVAEHLWDSAGRYFLDPAAP